MLLKIQLHAPARIFINTDTGKNNGVKMVIIYHIRAAGRQSSGTENIVLPQLAQIIKGVSFTEIIQKSFRPRFGRKISSRRLRLNASHL